MKSKDKIVQSLIELMETHEFEEITVKDISELAEVNRSTYYRNFKSKEAIIKYKLESIMDEYLKEFESKTIVKKMADSTGGESIVYNDGFEVVAVIVEKSPATLIFHTPAHGRTILFPSLFTESLTVPPFVIAASGVRFPLLNVSKSPLLVEILNSVALSSSVKV